jgi:hypothetical protein
MAVVIALSVEKIMATESTEEHGKKNLPSDNLQCSSVDSVAIIAVISKLKKRSRCYSATCDYRP